MLVLPSINTSIEVVLTSAVVVNEAHCTAFWTDVTYSTQPSIPGTSVVKTNGTTPVTFVEAPAPSTRRLIDYICVHNADTAPIHVTINYNNNGTLYLQWDGILLAGEKIYYNDDHGWEKKTEINETSISTDNPSGDAFGRLRVSTPLTIFDSKQVFNDPDLADSVENFPLFFDNQQISGSATTTTFDVNKAKTTLAVGASTAGRRVRQTKMRFNYQPGKSQLIKSTFVFSSANTAGVTRRVGLFDDNNGVFFDDNGTNYGFVVRTYTGGSPSDSSRVAQSAWNIDKMDGSGPSGITLDFTKTQILVIDFEWLGVGRVRFGWNVNGVTYESHRFLHANVNSDVYMSTPNLPLRTEIINSGAGAAASLSTICSSVISEGGVDELGIVRSASTNGTHVDADTENVIYAVLGIKLRSSHLGATIKLLNAFLLEGSGSKELEWMLLLNPTVAGTFTYTAESQSAVQIARGAAANTVTGGYRLGPGGFFSSASVNVAGTVGTSLINSILLGSTIAGVADELVIAVRPINGSTNTDIEGSLSWREIM